MIKNIYLWMGGTIGLIAVVAVVLWQWTANPVTLPETSFMVMDTPLPEIDLFTIGDGVGDGSEPTLPNTPFLLVIWATWCPTCRSEHSYLAQVAQDIPLVGIAMRDDDDAVIHMLKKHGNPFLLNFGDPLGRFSSSIGAQGTPTIFFVDSQGIIRARLIGGVNERRWRREKLKEFADSLS